MNDLQGEIATVILRNSNLTQVDLDGALAQQPDTRLDHYLVEAGLLSEDEVLNAFGIEFGLPTGTLAGQTIDSELLTAFPSVDLCKHEVLPVERDGDRVIVATHDPLNLEAFDELTARTGLRLSPLLVRRHEVLRALKDVYGIAGGTIEDMIAQGQGDVVLAESATTEDQAQHASVVRLVNELFSDAMRQRASDIHIEPEADGVAIRLRVDGMLSVEPVPPQINQFAAAIVSRIKIMAKLNIAEKRLPQDGRMSLRVDGKEVDVRVSTIPMMHGESIVMRLLDKGRSTFDLESLRLTADLEQDFRKVISRSRTIADEHGTSAVLRFNPGAFHGPALGAGQVKTDDVFVSGFFYLHLRVKVSINQAGIGRTDFYPG